MQYKWNGKIQIAPASPALLHLLLNPKGSYSTKYTAIQPAHPPILDAQNKAAIPPKTPPDRLVIPEGKRHTRLVSLTGSLCLQGAADNANGSPSGTSQTILALLRKQGKPMSAPAIANELDLDIENTRRMLSRLKEKGLVCLSHRGHYMAIEQTEGDWY